MNWIRFLAVPAMIAGMCVGAPAGAQDMEFGLEETGQSEAPAKLGTPSEKLAEAGLNGRFRVADSQSKQTGGDRPGTGSNVRLDDHGKREPLGAASGRRRNQGLGDRHADLLRKADHFRLVEAELERFEVRLEQRQEVLLQQGPMPRERQQVRVGRRDENDLVFLPPRRPDRSNAAHELLFAVGDKRDHHAIASVSRVEADGVREVIGGDHLDVSSAKRADDGKPVPFAVDDKRRHGLKAEDRPESDHSNA